MKLTIERDALLKALAHAASVVERRNTIPILDNLLIEAAGDGARIVATDLNLQIRLSVPARVEEEGATTVAVNTLHGILRELAPGAQVEFGQPTGEAKLTLQSGRSRYSLQTLPAKDFPSMPAPEDGVSFALAGKALAALLAKTSFAQLRNDVTRPYLDGTHMAVIDGKLVFAATNGHCLAEASCDAPEDIAELPGVTLPTKFVSELQKLLADADTNVAFAVGRGKAELSVGGAVITGKLLEGAFPDWRRVIPGSNDKRLLVGRETLAGAIRRTAVIASERTRAIKFDLTRDKLTCSTSSPESGLASEESPAVYDAAELSIGFNSKYLLETCAAIDGQELQADFADAGAPTLFTNPNDSSARWVVMPMRV